MNTFLNAPSATASDQFVNYNFNGFNFEVTNGSFINMQKGGNINVWGGSFIHTSAPGGTFFTLGGNSHAYGVMRFSCIGARFEHRVASSQLINCQWNNGAVSFISCDMSSSVQLIPATTILASFTSVNASMPTVKFDNCMLICQHEYKFNINSWGAPHNIMYENCEFTSALQAKDFIVFTNLAGNVGGTPTVHFHNCRGQTADNTTTIFDTDLGWNLSNRGTTSKKMVSIKNAGGQWPTAGSSEVINLPLNCVITKISLFLRSGAVTSAAVVTFSVKTNEATPTVLATTPSFTYSAGTNVNIDNINFVANSDLKRNVKLLASASVDQFTSEGYCLIEYIG